MMRADHRATPLSISVDKHAYYPEAFAASQEGKVIPLEGVEAVHMMRKGQVKGLNGRDALAR